MTFVARPGIVAASRRRTTAPPPSWSVQAGSGAVYSAGTTVTLPLPADVASGDLLLAFVDLTSVASLTLTGWTQIFNNSIANDDFHVLSKTAGSSESAPGFTVSVEQQWAGILVRVRGQGAAPAQLTAQTSTTTTASITPPDAGSLKIGAVNFDPAAAGTVTWSGGATSVGSAAAGSFAFVDVAYKAEDTAGALTYTTTATGTIANLIMSIKPA